MERNMKIAAVIVAIILIAGIVYIRAPNSAAAEDINIGHIAPLTGFLGAYGDQERQGIDLAIEEINAKGGINGHKLLVVHEDDQMDPTLATNAINKLITIDKVPAIIGELSSPVTLAIAPIAEKNKVVLITDLASSNKISEAGDYIFRVFPSDALDAKYLTDLASSLNLTNGAVLYVNTDFGTDMAQSVNESFIKNGGTITISEGYNPDATDFRTQLTKIKAKNPSAFFLIGLGNDMALILKQAKDIGLKSQFFAPTSFYDPRIIEMSGNSTEGVILDSPPSGDPKLWEEFNQKIKTKYGDNATIVTGMAYDTMNLLAAAMKSNNFTSDGIKTGLYQIENYPGVTGNITFDKNGDAIRVLKYKIVKGGKFEDYGA